MSRELDAEIAEKVMGWMWWHHPDARTQLLPPDATWAPELGLLPGKNMEDAREPLMGAPTYSTDIAAAWLVVEKMKERGYTWTLFIYGIGVQARVESGGRIMALVEFPTAPLAICEAALKAVGRS